MSSHRQIFIEAVLSATSLEDKIKHCQTYLEKFDASDPAFLFNLGDSYVRQAYIPESPDISLLEKAVDILSQIPSPSPKKETTLTARKGELGIPSPFFTAGKRYVTQLHLLLATLKQKPSEQEKHYQEAAPSSKTASLWASFFRAQADDWKGASDYVNQPESLPSGILPDDWNVLTAGKKFYARLKLKEINIGNDFHPMPLYYKSNMIIANNFLRDNRPEAAVMALEKVYAQIHIIMPNIINNIDKSEIEKLNVATTKDEMVKVFSEKKELSLDELFHFPYEDVFAWSRGELSHSLASQKAFSPRKMDLPTIIIQNNKDQKRRPYSYMVVVDVPQSRMLIFNCPYDQPYLWPDEFLVKEKEIVSDLRLVTQSLVSLYKQQAITHPEQALSSFQRINELHRNDLDAQLFLARTAYTKGDWDSCLRWYRPIFGKLFPVPEQQVGIRNILRNILFSDGDALSYYHAIFQKAEVHSHHLSKTEVALLKNAHGMPDEESCKMVREMFIAKGQGKKLTSKWSRYRQFGYDPLRIDPLGPYAPIWGALRGAEVAK